MKKILAGVIYLLVCLGLIIGCGGGPREAEKPDEFAPKPKDKPIGSGEKGGGAIAPPID
jgi:hypothetical protein